MAIHIKLSLAFFALTLACSSCQKLFIEPNPESTNEQNFELFWNDLHNNYPYFKKDKVDWQATYDKYRPQVDKSTSPQKLANIFIEMLTPLSDQHISLKTPFREWYISENKPDYDDYYNPEIINAEYLKNGHKSIIGLVYPEKVKREPLGKFGVINQGGNDYIYLRLFHFLTEYPFERTLDSLIKVTPNAKGVIIDVRNNPGGFVYSMIRLYGTFTTANTTYAIQKEKVGPLEENFSDEIVFPLFRNDYPLYLKPVALLTNRYSYSTAEHASLAMRKIAKGFVVGDTTAGAMSPVVQRTLPNGWGYTLVNSATTDTQGNNYENIGVPPTYTVTTKTAGRDDMIEKAIIEINRNNPL